MNLKIFSFTLFIAFAFNFANAQTLSSLSGKIIEQSTKEPMEFVNVALYYTTDSSLVTGVVTDKNGTYTFANVNEGKYYLQISFIGFETIFTPEFSVSTTSQIDKGTIEIKASSYVLNDVTVTDEKSILQTNIAINTHRNRRNVFQYLTCRTGSAHNVFSDIVNFFVNRSLQN